MFRTRIIAATALGLSLAACQTTSAERPLAVTPELSDPISMGKRAVRSFQRAGEGVGDEVNREGAQSIFYAARMRTGGIPIEQAKRLSRIFGSFKNLCEAQLGAGTFTFLTPPDRAMDTDGREVVWYEPFKNEPARMWSAADEKTRTGGLPFSMVYGYECPSRFIVLQRSGGPEKDHMQWSFELQVYAAKAGVKRTDFIADAVAISQAYDKGRNDTQRYVTKWLQTALTGAQKQYVVHEDPNAGPKGF